MTARRRCVTPKCRGQLRGRRFLHCRICRLVAAVRKGAQRERERAGSVGMARFPTAAAAVSFFSADHPGATADSFASDTAVALTPTNFAEAVRAWKTG